MRLFSWGIGKAYHYWLYERIRCCKDELSLLLGQQTTDIASAFKKKMEDQFVTINTQTEIITLQKAEIRSLEARLEEPLTGASQI